MMSRLAIWLATCGRLGFVPVAPGTFGSAAGLLVYYAIRWTGSSTVEVFVIGGLCIVGVWSATAAGRLLGSVDPGPVIIDEVVGMLITLWLLPVTPLGALVGFLLFRALDIVKPFPANRLEALSGGVGVMADDVMVGVYGNLMIRGLIVLTPGWLV